MILHAGAPLAPHDLLRAWTLDPAILIPIGIAAIIWVRGRRRSRLFAAGLLSLFVALVSPLHRAGDVLFFAHMIQHEILMLAAAPLLVLANPAAIVVAGIPVRFRRRVGKAITTVSHAVTPLAAFVTHAVAIWVWHIPGLYDASVSSDLVHLLQHVSFLGTGVVFWWTLIHSPRRSEGVAIASLFVTAIHTTLLGFLLTEANRPLYSVYNSSGSLSWGFTPLEDQQLGGLIMWIPGSLVYLAGALYLAHRWIGRSAKRANMRDAAIRTTMSVALIALIGCGRDAEWAAEMTGGVPGRGRDTMRKYGCQSCHSIPGVPGAAALVGPPLGGIASRSYIAGVMSNTPQHMIEWLRNPPGVDPKTAMPDMNVTERDARDMAAYLYTLR